MREALVLQARWKARLGLAACVGIVKENSGYALTHQDC